MWCCLPLYRQPPGLNSRFVLLYGHSYIRPRVDVLLSQTMSNNIFARVVGGCWWIFLEHPSWFLRSLSCRLLTVIESIVEHTREEVTVIAALWLAPSIPWRCDIDTADAVLPPPVPTATSRSEFQVCITVRSFLYSATSWCAAETESEMVTGRDPIKTDGMTYPRRESVRKRDHGSQKRSSCFCQEVGLGLS